MGQPLRKRIGTTAIPDGKIIRKMKEIKKLK